METVDKTRDDLVRAIEGCGINSGASRQLADAIDARIKDLQPPQNLIYSGKLE